MRCAIYTKLAFKVVSASIDDFMGALAFPVSNLADDNSVFLARSGIDHEFAFQFSSHKSWLEDGM